MQVLSWDKKNGNETPAELLTKENPSSICLMASMQLLH
jgi:hypothetical protein